MRNREELNEYIQKKAKTRMSLIKRRNNSIVKAMCVVLLLGLSLKFFDLMTDHTLYEPLYDSSIISNVNNSDAEEPQTALPMENSSVFDSESNFDETIFNNKEYRILYGFCAEANKSISAVSDNQLIPQFSSMSDGTIELNDSIIVKWENEDLELKLSDEQIDMLYLLVANIDLKAITVSEENAEVLASEKALLRITFLNKNYDIYIVDKNILFSDYWFRFEQEGLDIFLENLKKSVVE